MDKYQNYQPRYLFRSDRKQVYFRENIIEEVLMGINDYNIGLLARIY